MPEQSSTSSIPMITIRRGHRSGLLSSRKRATNFLYGMPVLERCFYCPYDYAMVIAYYSMLQSFFSLLTCMFNLYHSKSIQFLLHNNYSICFLGINIIDVSTLLVSCMMVLLVLSFTVTVTSMMLIPALQENQSEGMVIWLYSFGAFSVCRYVFWKVNGLVNNVYDVYDLVLPPTGTVMAVLNVYTWILIFSYNFKIIQINRLKKLIHLYARINATNYKSTYGSLGM